MRNKLEHDKLKKEEKSREFAEKLIANKGDCSSVYCGNCPLGEECHWGDSDTDTLEIAKAYIGQLDAK